MRRRAERGIRGIQLQSRRAAEDAEVADAIVPGDSFKYEAGTRVKARCRSFVPVARVESFRHESNANQPLWWSAIAAPEPTEFAIKLIVPLACRHFKAARAGFAATHLNHAWVCL